MFSYFYFVLYFDFIFLSFREPFLKLLYITPEKMVRCKEVRELLRALDSNEMLAR